MTDDELTLLAAKAAGYTLTENGTDINDNKWWWCEELEDNWYPLYSDGDALRLAVKLDIDIFCDSYLIDGTRCASVSYPQSHDWESLSEPHAMDKLSATRRAIVRAAAEIGKAMK